MLQHRTTAVQPSNLHQLFGVGALAHRGPLSLHRGLCGDHSPHSTTMTQTERCPIFKFGSWWCLTVFVPDQECAMLRHGFSPLVPQSASTVVCTPVAGERPHDVLEEVVCDMGKHDGVRTQTRPAIEFVSGEEGLRPKSYIFVYSFLEYVFHGLPEV